MNKFVFVTATVAAVLAASSAHSQHLASARSDGGVADIRPTPDAARLAATARPAEQARLQSVSKLSRLALPSLTPDSAGVTAFRIHNQSEVARLQGQIRSDLSAAYRLQPVPGNLTGGAVLPRIQSLNVGTMRLLADYYANLVAEKVQAAPASELTGDVLRQQGVGLPNGWMFKVNRTNEYEFVDRTSGSKFLCVGDPHLLGANREHYGDWTNSVMVFVLPGERPDAPTLVLAHSTGGDARNGFGLPTDVLVLGLKEWVWASGLNTDNPRGARGQGALFLHQAVAADIRAAHVLYWVPEANELRTAGGDRSAPPAAASRYDRKAPAQAKDPVKLFDGLLLASANPSSPVPAADQEVLERFTQAVAARSCPVNADAVKHATAYVGEAKQYGTATMDYITKRLDIMAQFEKLVESLELLDQEFTKPGLGPDEAEQLEKKRADLKRQIEALRQQLAAQSQPN